MSSPEPNPTTTDAGIPVASQEHSLTVGPDGPILLNDFYLIEQMANFNRERIPERQPHAKGSGAFGYFHVTGDVRQADTMVREVLDDPARDRLVSNAAGHLLDGVTEAVLIRAFQYWKNVDLSLGERIEEAVRDRQS